MKKVGHTVLVILVVLFLVLVMPIAINESYKHGVVYITKWDAADVLSYYGTLLGAGTTVAALVITIAFTKKQIQHDRFLDHNYTKWEKIETVITKILTDISPLLISDFEKTNGTNMEMLVTTYMHLEAYETTIKKSQDTMKCYINPHDHQQMTAFEKQFTDCITQFCEIEQKLKTEVGKLMTVASVNQGTVPDPAWFLFYNEIGEIIDKIRSAHDGSYQELLSKKRETFDKIYTDIEQQAEEILHFKKRKKDNYAHT